MRGRTALSRSRAGSDSQEYRARDGQGQSDRRGGGESPGIDPRHPAGTRLGGMRLCHRGGAGALRPQAGTLHGAGRGVKAGGDSGFQHLLHFHHPSGGADPEAGPGHRDALFQSCPGDEAGGGDPGAGDDRRNLRPGQSSGRNAWASRRSRSRMPPALSPTGS